MTVFFYGCISIDGYLADKNHSLEWLHQFGTTEETDYEKFYHEMDVVMMGKRTFNAISHLENVEYIYPTTQNYVFTHEPNFSVAGFKAVDCSVVDLVSQLDAQQNIWIVGGNTLLAPLLEAKMVDCLIIQIAPIILGEGIPLFLKSEISSQFELRELQQFGQFAQLTYDKC